MLPPIVVSEDEKDGDGEGEGEETSGETESMLVEDPSNPLLVGENGKEKEKEEDEKVADGGIAIKLNSRARAESFSQKARIGDEFAAEEDEVPYFYHSLVYHICDFIIIDYFPSLYLSIYIFWVVAKKRDKDFLN